MASIFNKTNNLYENPKRNTFDLSFQNNLTLNMGNLVPVFCKECLPGDTFKIDPTIALRAMPLLFPVQTRLRAHLHFFYVTNRSLWKDWQDFIGNTKDGLEMPYIDYLDAMDSKVDYGTGSLFDYLGVPTTVTSGTSYTKTFDWFDGDYNNTSYVRGENGSVTYHVTDVVTNSRIAKPLFVNEAQDLLQSDNTLKPSANAWSLIDTIDNAFGRFVQNGNITSNLRYAVTGEYDKPLTPINPLNPSDKTPVIRTGDLSFSFKQNATVVYYCSDCRFNDLTTNANSTFIVGGSAIASSSNHAVIVRGRVNDKQYYCIATATNNDGDLSINLNSNVQIVSRQNDENLPMDLNLREFALQYGSSFCDMFVLIDNYVTSSFATNGTLDSVASLSPMNISENAMYTNDVLEVGKNGVDSPYISNIKLNALPFRAYEAIYNSFYRDDRNNPLLINLKPVYNKWILNDGSGSDDMTNLKLYQRNWESDFLTTAVQSPQQGIAPLVGITARGEITFKDSDTGELYSATLNTGSDGDVIDSFTVTSPNMPTGNLRQLVDFASSGISISDLRGVNALQRWLEINMRRGLRYKDQIMSHFGVDVRFDELMMPEFIGGLSTDIYVNQINQTTPTDGQPLGYVAGQMGAFGSSQHSISHYCQEHGYIIGILSIAPTPQYSQLLPKHFLKRQLLDYYFPEFGHLGMQPITYQEVCPNEAYFEGKPLTDVFGYQRAWYDYLASTDEVHGLFRTNLNNFVVQRIFSGAPELSPEFLTINPNTLDSVFSVESDVNTSHKFLGQIYFDCKVKRCIPEYGIPKLEV